MANGFPLEQWFWEMPPLTRWWTTSAVICSVMVQCHIISPFNLFYSVRAVFTKGQVHISPPLHRQTLTRRIVLAPPLHLLLFRSPLTRSHLPSLLPPTLLAPSRRELWPLTRPLLLPPQLRVRIPTCPRTSLLDRLPWHGAFVRAGVHLEPP